MAEDHQVAPIRVLLDGCFDGFHFGHANAIRQAKLNGDVLIVGVHDDDEITRAKGPPLFHNEERLFLVEACKWVDEVIFGLPYTTQLSDLIKYDIDFVLHGEDISIDANGRDSYEAIKAAGKFKLIKRTEGVSTTDIVDRILAHAAGETLPISSRSSLFATARKIAQFANIDRAPKSTDRIVLVDGGFDMFHAGHADLLRQAKAFGDFVLVGVQSDADIRSRKGAPFPILTLTERVLSCLACKWCDDVVQHSPVIVDDHFLDSMRICAVVYLDDSDAERHVAAKNRGILHKTSTKFPHLSTHAVCERIIGDRALFEDRNARKAKKEAETAARMKAMNIVYKVEEI